MLKKILFCMVILSNIWGNSLKIGDVFTSMTLPDQFGTIHTIDNQNFDTVIVSFEKDVSAMMTHFLKDKPENFLEENKTVFISDIHEMPSFVTSLFALPKMKKYNYKMMLLYEENLLFPKKEKSLTVIRLKNNKVLNISYITEENQISNLFD